MLEQYHQVLYMHIKVWEALDYIILHHKHLLIDQLIDKTHVDDSQEFHEFKELWLLG